MKQIAHRIFVWIAFLGAVLLVDGCFGLIDGRDYNEGLIHSNYPSSNPSQTRICYEPGIVSFSDSIPRQNIVIDSDSSLQAYFDSRRYEDPQRYSPNFPCINFKPEPVDFTKYTLLGNYAAGGCDVAFTRRVVRDDRAKKYVYTINVRDAGACKLLGYSMNWVLVPKLPPGYSVVFSLR